jgi:hypothetical protein
MNNVRKFDGVLNEKHRNVVTDDVPVTFLSVDFYGEAADVARQVGRAFVTGHRRETHKQRRFLPCSLEQIGFRDVRQRLIVLEITMRSKPAGVNHPLGYTLVVEVEDLLTEVKVFERGGSTCSDLEGILIVGYRNALLGGQYRSIAAGYLMCFSSGTDRQILIAVLHRFSVFGNALWRVRLFTLPRHMIS